MEENVVSLDEGNIHILRNEVEKKLSQSEMRRKLIGGISEEDVSTYVENMKKQFWLVEEELRKQLRELQHSKDEMRKEYEDYKHRNSQEKASAEKVLEETLAEVSCLKEECSEKDSRIQELSERFDSETGRLTDANIQLEIRCNELKQQLSIYESEAKADGELALKIRELEEQLAKSQELVEEYQMSMRELEERMSEERTILECAQKDRANLNSSVVGFKNEIDAIYKQLGNLSEQVSANESLQQELESERLRAEKAQQDIFRFWELMSGLKEKFHKDQQLLGTLFGEIEEKQNAMQDDINGLRENLEDFCKATGAEIDDLFASLEDMYKLK